MIRKLVAVAFLLAMAAPAVAQAPPGWEIRVDRSTNAADPDDVPDVDVTAMGNGFQVTTGPAVVLWNPDNTASGEYTLRGTFTMLEPSDHRNSYGLIFGGGDLGDSGQNYLYFLVDQEGSFLIKHRANDDDVHDVVERAVHDAVDTPDSDGRSVNALEVRVGSDATEFVINGTVVHTAPRSGMAALTDGIWGIRVNHRLPAILVEGLSLRR